MILTPQLMILTSSSSFSRLGHELLTFSPMILTLLPMILTHWPMILTLWPMILTVSTNDPDALANDPDAFTNAPPARLPFEKACPERESWVLTTSRVSLYTKPTHLNFESMGLPPVANDSDAFANDPDPRGQ